MLFLKCKSVTGLSEHFKRMDALLVPGEPKHKWLNAFLFRLIGSVTIEWSFQCSVAVSLDRLWQQGRHSVNAVEMCSLWPAKEGEFLYWLHKGRKGIRTHNGPHSFSQKL